MLKFLFGHMPVNLLFKEMEYFDSKLAVEFWERHHEFLPIEAFDGEAVQGRTRTENKLSSYIEVQIECAENVVWSKFNPVVLLFVYFITNFKVASENKL
jgi:hypothetical protein